MNRLTVDAPKSSPSTKTNNNNYDSEHSQTLAGHLFAAIQQVNGEGLSPSSSVNDVKVMTEAILPEIVGVAVSLGAGGENTQTFSMVKQKKLGERV